MVSCACGSSGSNSLATAAADLALDSSRAFRTSRSSVSDISWRRTQFGSPHRPTATRDLHSCATGARPVASTEMGPPPRGPVVSSTRLAAGSQGLAFAICDAGVALSRETPLGGTEMEYDPGRSAMLSRSRGRIGVSVLPVNLIVAPMRTALPMLPNALMKTKCDDESDWSPSSPPGREFSPEPECSPGPTP